MATIQGQLNTPRDTTIQATNTALGLLGKDASLQDIKAALLQIVAALDPTADDYDDLSNKPQVNGVTLSGNKTSKQLGIRQTIPLTSAQYAQLTSAEKMDVDKDYIITDENSTAAPIDDSSVSRNSVWSSYKTNDEIDSLDSAIPKYTLLWTNQNPTADFAAQRILEGVDISQYDFLLISTSNGDCTCKPGYLAYNSIYGTGGGVYYAFSRYFDCRVPTNGISVADDYRIKIQDGTYGVANSNNIPITVYGVKIPT